MAAMAERQEMRACARPAAVDLPAVRWFCFGECPADDEDKWAAVRDVAQALGVSDRALQQWIAPARNLRDHDVSDSLRLVPCADLPTELRTRRGRTMISAAAVDEYVRTVHRKHGQKRRAALSADEVRALLPLRVPRVSIDTLHVYFDEGAPVPRERLVSEWLEPLAAQLGYALVPLAAVAPDSAAETPINVCTVKRKKQSAQT
jgi:hypothetical protein